MIDEYRMIGRYTIDGFDSPSMIGRVVIEQSEKSQNSSDIRSTGTIGCTQIN